MASPARVDSRASRPKSGNSRKITRETLLKWRERFEHAANRDPQCQACLRFDCSLMEDDNAPEQAADNAYWGKYPQAPPAALDEDVPSVYHLTLAESKVPGGFMGLTAPLNDKSSTFVARPSWNPVLHSGSSARDSEAANLGQASAIVGGSSSPDSSAAVVGAFSAPVPDLLSCSSVPMISHSTRMASMQLPQVSSSPPQSVSDTHTRVHATAVDGAGTGAVRSIPAASFSVEPTGTTNRTPVRRRRGGGATMPLLPRPLKIIEKQQGTFGPPSITDSSVPRFVNPALLVRELENGARWEDVQCKLEGMQSYRSFAEHSSSSLMPLDAQSMPSSVHLSHSLAARQRERREQRSRVDGSASTGADGANRSHGGSSCSAGATLRERLKQRERAQAEARVQARSKVLAQRSAAKSKHTTCAYRLGIAERQIKDTRNKQRAAEKRTMDLRAQIEELDAELDKTGGRGVEGRDANTIKKLREQAVRQMRLSIQHAAEAAQTLKVSNTYLRELQREEQQAATHVKRVHKQTKIELRGHRRRGSLRIEAMKKKLLLVNRDILRLEAELNVHETERQAALAVLHERMRSQDGAESALHSFVSAHHGAHGEIAVEEEENETEKEMAALKAKQKEDAAALKAEADAVEAAKVQKARLEQQKSVKWIQLEQSGHAGDAAAALAKLEEDNAKEAKEAEKQASKRAKRRKRKPLLTVESLQAYFTKFDPDKVDNAAYLLEVHGEDKIISFMTEQYGESPVGYGQHKEAGPVSSDKHVSAKESRAEVMLRRQAALAEVQTHEVKRQVEFAVGEMARVRAQLADLAFDRDNMRKELSDLTSDGPQGAEKLQMQYAAGRAADSRLAKSSRKQRAGTLKALDAERHKCEATARHRRHNPIPTLQAQVELQRTRVAAVRSVTESKQDSEARRKAELQAVLDQEARLMSFRDMKDAQLRGIRQRVSGVSAELEQVKDAVRHEDPELLSLQHNRVFSQRFKAEQMALALCAGAERTIARTTRDLTVSHGAATQIEAVVAHAKRDADVARAHLAHECTQLENLTAQAKANQPELKVRSPHDLMHPVARTRLAELLQGRLSDPLTRATMVKLLANDAERIAAAQQLLCAHRYFVAWVSWAHRHSARRAARIRAAPYHITCILPSQRTVSLATKPYKTWREVKEQLCHHTALRRARHPPEAQHLIFLWNGQEVADEATLSKSGFKDGSAVKVQLDFAMGA